MNGFNMDDYVDVAQRIHDFYEEFPEGRLCCGTQPFVMEIGGKPFVWYHARAYRTPDDPLPGDGWAAEPVPGPTQFTRDSELMNAETAAWGRAIVALGFSTKKIASAQEVKARTSEPASFTAPALRDESPPQDGQFRFPSGKYQGQTLFDAPSTYLDWYLENGPRQDVKDAIDEFRGAIPMGAAGYVEDDGIPFDRTIDGLGG